MPAALERKLKQEANKKGLTGERKDAYTYGTLRKTGWKPSREKQKEKKMNDPSESINFAGLGEELPAVGKSLERLRNIVKNPRPPGLRIDVARGRVGAVGPSTRTSGLSKYWSTPGEIKSYKMAKSAGYSGAPAPDKPTAYLGRGGPARGPVLYSASSKLIRLAQIDDRLDNLIRFAYDDDDPNKKTGSILKAGALVGAAGAGAYGGTLAHQAVGETGGYAKNWLAGKAAFGRGLRGTGLQGVTKGPGRAVGSALGKVAGAVKPLLKRFLESKEKPIEFDATILGPWHGKTGHTSKIDQLEFPAGANPGFAPWAKNLSRDEMLKLPFPKLMQYMNQRNLQQQVFSNKMERLIELNSKLDESII